MNIVFVYHVHICVHIYIYTYVNIITYIDIQKSLSLYMYTYIYIWIYIYIYIYMYIYVHIHTLAFSPSLSHTQTRTHTHTIKDTHMYVCILVLQQQPAASCHHELSSESLRCHQLCVCVCLSPIVISCTELSRILNLEKFINAYHASHLSWKFSEVGCIVIVYSIFNTELILQKIKLLLEIFKDV